MLSSTSQSEKLIVSGFGSIFVFSFIIKWRSVNGTDMYHAASGGTDAMIRIDFCV